MTWKIAINPYSPIRDNFTGNILATMLDGVFSQAMGLPYFVLDKLNHNLSNRTQENEEIMLNKVILAIFMT